MTRFSARMAALLSAVMSSPSVDKFEQSWSPAPQFRGPTRYRRRKGARDTIVPGSPLAKLRRKAQLGTLTKCHP